MEHPKKEIGQNVELTEVSSSATQEAQEPPLKHGDIQTEKSPDTIEEENPEALEPDVQELPPVVRKIVSLEDDPTLPTITFRFFVLSVFFIAPGAFMSQLTIFRTTYAAYSIFFVQIACHYAGRYSQ